MTLAEKSLDVSGNLIYYYRMKILRKLLASSLGVLVLFCTYSYSIAQNIVDESLWENRILIFCNASGNERSPMYLSLIGLDDGREYYDRDIIFVHISKWNIDKFYGAFDTSHYFPKEKGFDVSRRDLGVQEVVSISKLMECEPDKNSLALMGKDGTLKARWDEKAPTTEDLFSIIDAMPMRQREIKERL